MRIGSVNHSILQSKPALKNSKLQSKNVNNLSFKGKNGKIFGGFLGGASSLIGAMAIITNPATLTAAVLIAGANTVGAFIGSAVGDAIEGKDNDED